MGVQKQKNRKTEEEEKETFMHFKLAIIISN